MDLSQIFAALLWVAALENCLSTLLGFLGRAWWGFELFSHFRVQYVAALAVCMVLFLGLGVYAGALISAAFALLNLAFILPIYRHKPAAVQADHPHRAILANVYQGNRQYKRVIDLVHSNQPDFVALIEVNRNWMEQLWPILDEYPHRADCLREDNYGLAVISRLPFILAEKRWFGESGVPSITAMLNLDGKIFTIVATHPPPPKGGRNAKLRNRQLEEIATFIKNQGGAVMLMGDLNMTSWSPYFQRLIKTAGLRDSRQGLGIQATWPTDKKIFLVPLDHILVSSGIQIHQRKVGAYTGSDHYPVILDFSIS